MNKTAKKRPISSVMEDEEISSGSDSDINDEIEHEESDTIDDEDEEELETAQEKKIRLAKQLISQLDSTNVDVSAALDEDLQSKIGKLKRELASTLESVVEQRVLKKSAHRLAITCTAYHAASSTLFSASKDGRIVKWDLEKSEGGRRGVNVERKDGGGEHRDVVLALAISDDGKFLASGGADRSVKIWNPKTCEFVYSFVGHKDTVSGLVFRRDTHQLFSCSFDRSVKVWNVDQLAYVETLFGHQDKVLAIDSFARERCLSCGGRDRSLRLWKIVEESQLVFTGSNLFDSIDCVRLISEDQFISGSNDGHLSIWHINKKKPLVTIKNAHAGWICSLATYKNSDLIASGSNDGFVRIWAYNGFGSGGQTNGGTKSVGGGPKSILVEKFKVPLEGFVNSLEFSADGKTLIAGVGQEHKLGRWSVNKKARNSIVIFQLEFTQTNDQQNGVK